MVQKRHGIIWKKMTLMSNQLKNSNSSNSPWQHFVKVNSILPICVIKKKKKTIISLIFYKMSSCYIILCCILNILSFYYVCMFTKCTFLSDSNNFNM